MLIGAILIGMTLFSSNDDGADGKVDVPNMVGSTVEQAQRLAENSEIVLKVGSKEPCEAQEKGKICSQSPGSQEQMATGETVTVVVSTGAPKVEVPDVLEKSEESARKALEDKGFTVNVKTAESEKTPTRSSRRTPRVVRRSRRTPRSRSRWPRRRPSRCPTCVPAPTTRPCNS